MLTIILVESGKQGLNSILDRLEIPISQDAQKFIAADKNREKLKSSRKKKDKGRFTPRLNEAPLQFNSAEQSCGAGICDASVGPSADMTPLPSIPSHQESSAQSYEDISNNSFVVIPFRPPNGWYAARVINVDMDSRKVELEWLHTNNGHQFFYKQPGDRGYETRKWEFFNDILCVIPPPDTVCTSRKTKMVMRNTTIGEIDRQYAEWKKCYNY